MDNRCFPFRGETMDIYMLGFWPWIVILIGLYKATREAYQAPATKELEESSGTMLITVGYLAAHMVIISVQHWSPLSADWLDTYYVLMILAVVGWMGSVPVSLMIWKQTRIPKQNYIFPGSNPRR